MDMTDSQIARAVIITQSRVNVRKFKHVTPCQGFILGWEHKLHI